MKLWHDDIRRPPEGWVWARTNAEAKRLLATGEVVEASLDHDLGLHELDPSEYERPEVLRGSSQEGDGYELVRWMCETGHLPERVTIHSWNPDGARRMAVALAEFGCPVVVTPFQMPDPYRSLWESS